MIQDHSPPSIFTLYRSILRPEARVYWLMLVYGLAVSALTLAVPLSVQVLISTVANTALLQPVLMLAAVLGILLLLSGMFVASQFYLMELFERRFFARIVSSVTLRLLYARHDFMERINRDELVNRYFDVMTVQKTLPPLLTGGLALALQTLVGVTLTSFYHPVFLIFNVSVLGLVWVVYRLCHRGAERSAVVLSGTKYACAKWLEDLARSNSFFKSTRAIDYALNRTLSVRDAYLAAHRTSTTPSRRSLASSPFMPSRARPCSQWLGGWSSPGNSPSASWSLRS
jgi:putative ABC transport system ATP-binding protein